MGGDWPFNSDPSVLVSLDSHIGSLFLNYKGGSIRGGRIIYEEILRTTINRAAT